MLPRVFTLAQIQAALAHDPQSSAAQVVDAIEQCFVNMSSGRATVAPVVHLGPFDPTGALVNDACVKCGFVNADAGGEHFVVKIASGGFAHNRERGLPTADGLMVVFSQTTGMLEGLLLDQGYLTDLRTAAAGAVAARYLAPPDLQCIGVLGSGIQARFQVRLLASVTACRNVVMWGRSPERTREACADVEAMGLGFSCRAVGSAAEVAAQSRLIVTTTSSKKFLLRRRDVRPGTHITAVGADGIGKQELDPAIVGDADVVVADSRRQCVEFGELSHAVTAGLLVDANVIELGAFISGARVKGSQNLRRQRDDMRITVFDSTGVGIQDVAISSLVLKKLVAHGGDATSRL